MSLTATDSPHSVTTTIDRLVSALNHRGITVFARIDHGGNARGAGLELAGEELLVFGDPSVGTLLMRADPEIGYELPLRVLVWDVGGQTRVGYRRPSEVAAGFAGVDQKELLGRMDGLLEVLVAESVSAAT
jgi:beta-galactosidase